MTDKTFFVIFTILGLIFYLASISIKFNYGRSWPIDVIFIISSLLIFISYHGLLYSISNKERLEN